MSGVNKVKCELSVSENERVSEGVCVCGVCVNEVVLDGSKTLLGWARKEKEKDIRFVDEQWMYGKGGRRGGNKTRQRQDKTGQEKAGQGKKGEG